MDTMREGANQRAHVTDLLDQLNRGDTGAFDSLVSAVYDELRLMAASIMRARSSGQTLQPTALVHEAWMRLSGSEQQWENRAHFFGAAARAMRQVLVANARHHGAQKRAGARVTFRDLQVEASEPELDVLLVHDALSALAQQDERLARIMELRYFGGLTVEEIAEVEQRSPASIKRDWTYARAWLYDHMGGA
jgi:RNA polymerase sigma factor (TIGR02999 family)